jgi:hypothetical protein
LHEELVCRPGAHSHPDRVTAAAEQARGTGVREVRRHRQHLHVDPSGDAADDRSRWSQKDITRKFFICSICAMRGESNGKTTSASSVGSAELWAR